MDKLLITAQQVISTEAEEISLLGAKLDDTFVSACNMIKNCTGKTVLMGMGKSGHIARKIAATFASTGTPAFFVHPAEAGHGDLGMISAGDICIVISYSGTNDEILVLMPLLKRLGVSVISMTGNSKSSMAKAADINLDVSVKKEACPHNLAPTTSTTVALVMGDALAISLLQSKGFSSYDFAKTHPSGALGRRLLVLVRDIMCTGENAPFISSNINIIQALLVMTESSMGFVMVVDDAQKLLGVFTDGDLRRLLQQQDNISNLHIFDIMAKNCHSIDADKAATSALEMMERLRINALPVSDNNKIIGAISMHNLLNAKII